MKYLGVIILPGYGAQAGSWVKKTRLDKITIDLLIEMDPISKVWGWQEDDRVRLFRIIKGLEETHDFIVIGFSRGVYISYKTCLACDNIAGFVGHSGKVPKIYGAPQFPVLFIHGTKDLTQYLPGGTNLKESAKVIQSYGGIVDLYTRNSRHIWEVSDTIIVSTFIRNISNKYKNYPKYNFLNVQVSG